MNTIHDLLYYFPNYHHDYSQIVNIVSLNYDFPQTIKVTISAFSSIRLKKGRGRTLQRAIAHDDSGSIPIVWFNQPYIEDIVNSNEEFLLAAKLDKNSPKPQLLSPEIEPIKIDKETVHIGRITPVYPLTEGIKQKWIRQKIKWLIDHLEYIVDLVDPLNDEVKVKFNLIDLLSALKYIHFPENQEVLLIAKKRLGFDELLDIQLKLEVERQKRNLHSSIKINKEEATKIANKIISTIPFELTKGQLGAINELINDLTNSQPARRLIQGDVGSGKTIVAIIAACIVAKEGFNSIIMAPTSILAKQLFENFKKILLDAQVPIQLITSDIKNRENNIVSIEEDIKNRSKKLNKTGKITIGTHALLYQKENTDSPPGLVIIDEQHRFGVEQRQKLLTTIREGGTTIIPNYIVMSATPIPRTIAQIIFGDMDRTVIAEKPKNRKDVKTYLTPNSKRLDSYKWILDKIKNSGEQVFWVCPLIELSDKIEAKSVLETFEEVQKIFKTCNVKFLHGRLSEEEKNNVLKEFAEHKFDILVTTSLIEVGIDIPNANTIVIESAERFGLAQLHQLRGRVGRGEKEGYCILYVSKENQSGNNAIERLKFFSKETDGFKIAEFDLENRGPGEVYGYKQSGIPDLKIASFTDFHLIEETREAAKIILSHKNVT